jgi:hypothetical protein
MSVAHRHQRVQQTGFSERAAHEKNVVWIIFRQKYRRIIVHNTNRAAPMGGISAFQNIALSRENATGSSWALVMPQ